MALKLYNLEVIFWHTIKIAQYENHFLM